MSTNICSEFATVSPSQVMHQASRCSTEPASRAHSRASANHVVPISDEEMMGCLYDNDKKKPSKSHLLTSDFIAAYFNPHIVPLTGNNKNDSWSPGGGIKPLCHKCQRTSENGPWSEDANHNGEEVLEMPSLPESHASSSESPQALSKSGSGPTNLPSPAVNSEAEGGVGTTRAHRGCIGGFTPLVEDVKLKDVGESLFFNDSLYMAWRILYLVLCFAGVVTSLLELDGPAGLSACLAMTYMTISAMVSLRRLIQLRLVKRDERGTANEHSFVPLSWLDVMTIQAGPVVFVMIGVALPIIFNTVFVSRGLAISFYISGTFYISIALVILTVTDMWVGAVPTKITYVLFSTVLNSALALGAAWGFRPKLVLWTVVGIACWTMFIGTLFHVLVRNTVVRDDGHPPPEEAAMDGLEVV